MELEEYEKEQKMKKTLIMFIGVLLVVCTVLAVQQSEKMRDSSRVSRAQSDALQSLRSDNPSRSILKNCPVEQLDIHFLCHHSWTMKKHNDNLVTYQIDTNPSVQLKIARFDVDILYIQQLSKNHLGEIGQYAPGFAVEDAKVAGLKAIKVKAYSDKNIQMRLLDYYFVRDQGKLYALMFSVAPKSEWDGYKFIFQRIVDSFKFIQ